MIRKIYALSIVVLMLSVVMVGSVSAFTSDINDEFKDDDFEDIPIPDSSYDWSYPDNPLIWTGAGDDNLASNPENWNDGIVPYNGADVVFDGTSVKDCTWDIEAFLVTVNSLALATGYTGTLTQGDVDIGIGAGGYLQQDGVFIGNTARYIYNDGDIVRTGGSIPGISTRWVMTGNDSMIYSTKYGYFHSLIINGHTTYTGTVSDFVVHRLEVNGKFTVDSRLRLAHETNRKFTIDNKGIIDGLGVLELWIANVSPTLNLGNIDCELRIASRTGDYQANLEGPATLNHLYVGTIGNNIITFDVSNQVVILSTLTIGEKAIIVGDGTIINHGDSHIYGSVDGHIVQASPGTITMHDGSYLDRLTVLPKASLHLGSDLYLGRFPTHHYNIFSPDGYGYWIDDTFYMVPIWESVSDDEKPYIAIIFLVLVLVISIIGYHYRIVLLQLVSLLCLAYGISRYISHPVVEWYPIYLILTLAGIVMIIYSIIRR